MPILSSLNIDIVEALYGVTQRCCQVEATRDSWDAALVQKLATLHSWERLQIFATLQQLTALMPELQSGTGAVRIAATNEHSANSLVLLLHSGGSTAASIEVADCSNHSLHSRILS
ncbi:hypothetical protein ETAA8_53130 [Anatilimnocola aggregata]|uniref:Uncharacterized protein n=1 Tax=Anatilimnocola aggregata TaxID=2528021 RepID=A0A517YJ04_9BACT|nr:hypothetical protein [Anatilimnocola aggregata]QDU30194.1 hypothetical protein ETAA8_53130 [Anatilimnocola aggregata]